MEKNFRPGLAWGRNLLFLLLYINCNVIFGLAAGYIDAGWIAQNGLLLLFYGILLGVAFFASGYILPRASERQSWVTDLVSVLLVPLVALIIWCLHYFHLQGVRYKFNDIFSWTFYLLYTIWSFPFYQYMEGFFANNQRGFAFLGLLFSIFPSLFAFLGIRARPEGLLSILQKRKKLLGGAGALGILAISVIIIIPLMIPHPFTAKTYPRVDGATAAIPMGQIFAQKLTGMNTKQAKEFVRFNTTHEAYMNLIFKRCDIVFAAEPSKEELKLAEQNNVRLKLTPIGRDAFVFMVHKDNPVNNLSLKQIQDIYTDKITNWKEVGGEDQPIIAYQREPNSGSQTLMQNKVMAGLTMASAPKEKVIGGMGGLMNAVAEYKNSRSSLGYSVYYYASEMNRKEEIKFLAVNGIECNSDAIRSGKYPLSGNLNAITREEEPESSAAAKMLRWILSPAGQRAVEKGGYVPVGQ